MYWPLRVTRDEIDYLCYVPTFRANAPDGVILCEIHALRLVPVPVSVRLPKTEEDRIRQRVLVNPPQAATAEQWARDFLNQNPSVRTAIQAMALTATVALVIAGIILCFDPAPGDEAASFAAAAALFRLATGKI